MRILTTSYLKENMAEIVKNMPEDLEPIGITHNGEVKLIVQNPDVFQATSDTLTMLMALNFTERQRNRGEFSDLDSAIDDVINDED